MTIVQTHTTDIWLSNITNYHILSFITLVNHVGGFHDLGICHLYSVGPSNNLGIFLYYSYIEVEPRNLGGVMLPALCVGVIIHPKNIRMKHCSSHYLSPKIL